VNRARQNIICGRRTAFGHGDKRKIADYAKAPGLFCFVGVHVRRKSHHPMQDMAVSHYLRCGNMMVEVK
jgi:hypothetical protein